MRRTLILSALTATLATPALALEITNLDRIDHRVLFESAGGREEILVKVNRTESIDGQPNGRLSLLTAKKPSRGDSLVQADGILSGVFAGKRTQGIPADSADAFVIWEGGDIRLQQRWRGGRLHGR